MFSDNQDKTVFKQPVPGGDRTVMRPNPGGRNQGEYQPSQPSREQASPLKKPVPVPLGNDSGAASFYAERGLNPLINSASTLIAVLEKTQQSMSHSDVGGLHQRLINEIKTFELRVRDQGVQQKTMLAARYLLCTVLDEAVLNTPWGSESAWAQRSLLTVFHGETSGGEKSFVILDRMREAPAENINIIELFYICISLGFEGKYRLMNRGRDALDKIRDELFAIIRTHRGEYERSLSPRWQGLGNARNSLTEYLPLWVVTSLVFSLLFLSFLGFRYWMHVSTESIVEQLVEISTDK